MEDLALILIILNPNLAANYECLILNPRFYYVPLLCKNFYEFFVIIVIQDPQFFFQTNSNFYNYNLICLTIKFWIKKHLEQEQTSFKTVCTTKVHHRNNGFPYTSFKLAVVLDSN